MRVLVVNVGSSSLKLRVVDPGDQVIAASDLASPGGRPDLDALGRFASETEGIEASGHRIVHGGARFRDSVVVDRRVLEDIQGLGELAPLHGGHETAALERVLDARPDLPAVACFDTSFHATLPDHAAHYAIPAEWADRWGIRRYGFHGLSHAYASGHAAKLLGRPASELRLVTCHLGAGASLAAVAGGRSVDTTMGFTPLEGLVMATRSGSVDPGAVLWLAERAGLEPAEVRRCLNEESGLLGLSGLSGDMRALLAAAAEGNERARLAIDVYVHRLRGSVAAMAAAMGGVDAVVFTGGIGENSPAIRKAACEGLEFLGLALDADRNDAAIGSEGDISAPEATTRALVVEAREELEVAREVRRLLSGVHTAPGS